MGDLNRTVVLVSLDWFRPGDGRRSLGAASIAAALRDAGAEVRWLDDGVNRPGFDLADFTNRVVSAAAGLSQPLIGLGCYVWNEPEVLHLIEAIRAAIPAAEIVLGGPQVSFADAGTLSEAYPGVCYFVRGYGEDAMVSLATGAAQNGQHGLFDTSGPDGGARHDGSLVHLPSPYLTGVLEAGREVRWETQRGCPFRCSFCQHREPNLSHRKKPLHEDRLAAELELFARCGVERISVLDPIFHVDRKRAVSLLGRARALGLRSKVSLQCRLELIHPDFLEATRGLDLTLEFGLQTTNLAESKAVGRRNRMDRCDEGLRAVRELGIDHEISLIFGLPHQTLGSFLESVQWCLERGVPRVRAYPLMLLRGTPIHAEHELWGFAESGGRISEVVESFSMSRADNAEMREVAHWLDRHPGARTLPSRWQKRVAA